MRNLRKKVYEEYKIIGINQIKGIGERRYSEEYNEKLEIAKRSIRRFGLVAPFEVEKTSNGYRLLSHPLKFYAAKQLNYRAVPCLIRNRMHEIILHKNLKMLDID